MKTEILKQLFEEEDKIHSSVRQIGELLLELSDFSLAKSALELAKVQVIGKRLRNVCDEISDHVHHARKKLGSLMLHHTHVQFKKADKSLHDMERELSLIHGNLETIGSIAESFFESTDRKAAFANLNSAYNSLVQNVMSLLVDESSVKKVVLH